MDKRRIPPVADDPRLGESRLVHVTAVLRHGARTPHNPNLNCWEGYRESKETGVWNCNLTTYLSPPPPERVTEEGADVGLEESMFLFEKRYDALVTPQYNLSNSLNGTCQLGQLILQGYEQELANGHYLRDAYVYDGSNFDHNERMRLLDVHQSRDDPAWEHLYYRVDDDQRTLMSGQVVLRGLFGPEMADHVNRNKKYPVIPLHTADRERDIVDPNEDLCPRLAELRERAEQSTAFQAFNQSTEAQLLRDFQRNVLRTRPDKDMDAIDCLMTTICTDRPLPDAVNDYAGNDHDRRKLSDADGEDTLLPELCKGNCSKEGSDDYGNYDEDPNLPGSGDASKDYGMNLFQRLYDFRVKEYAIPITANDGEFSKKAMGPLWAEMSSKMQPFLDDSSKHDSNAKLALYAGHDTTLMPLLASLGPRVWNGEWPPYASMMIIELHEVHIDGQTDSSMYRTNFAFRLIYNGQVLTHLLDDCPEDAELCDAAILMRRIKPFAVLDADCRRQHPPPVVHQDTVSRTKEILSTTGGIVLFVLLIFGSAAAGSVLTYAHLTGNLPGPGGRHRLASDEEDGVALTTNGNGHAEESFSETEMAAINATLT
jgi:hypothetical protein